MKLMTTILFFFSILQGTMLCGQSPFYRSSDAIAEDQSVRGCLQQVFNSQIGVIEKTGRNDGKEVEAYLSSVGFTKGYAWCGAFIHWTLDQCGSASHFKYAKDYAWTPNYEKLTTKDPRIYQAEVGDLILLYYAKLGRVGHVGFIDYWSAGNKVVTIEGNTNGYGSREGDGVHVKYRLKSQLYKVVKTF